MPEWLLKEENYIPPSDKDTFINKSILSLLQILSKIKAQSGYKKDKFHINTPFKVVFTFMLIVLLSLSRSLTFIMIITVYLLAVLSSMNAKEIISILKISFLMSLFTFIILIPAVFYGNSYSSIFITTKVFASVIAVNILSHSTRWLSITSALKTFFVPDLFIFILDITIKYIVMLGEFSLNMFYALKLRSVGKNKSKYTSLSGIAGTMFIQSKEMAEDMYSAMACRGFTGEYPIYNHLKLTFFDFIYMALNAGILFTFVYFERI